MLQLRPTKTVVQVRGMSWLETKLLAICWVVLRWLEARRIRYNADDDVYTCTRKDRSDVRSFRAKELRR